MSYIFCYFLSFSLLLSRSLQYFLSVCIILFLSPFLVLFPSQFIIQFYSQMSLCLSLPAFHNLKFSASSHNLTLSIIVSLCLFSSTDCLTPSVCLYVVPFVRHHIFDSHLQSLLTSSNKVMGEHKREFSRLTF